MDIVLFIIFVLVICMAMLVTGSDVLRTGGGEGKAPAEAKAPAKAPAKAKARTKYAHVVLVMKGDAYVIGAQVVMKSLKNVGTKYDCVAIVTPDVTPEGRKRLSIVCDYVVEVPYLEAHTIQFHSAKQEKIYGSWKNVAYTKWQSLNPAWIPYEKIHFVDADMVYVANVDSMIEEMPAPTGIFATAWAQPWISAARGGAYNAYKARAYGDEVKPTELKKGLSRGFVANGAPLVLAPDEARYKKMLGILTECDEKHPYGHVGSISMSDEQLLADVFDDVVWHHITPDYGWFAGKFEYLENRPVKCYHYYNLKPWNEQPDKWPDLVHWWKVAKELEYAPLA